MMIHCNSYKASMRAEHFLYLNNSIINLGRKFGTSKMHLSPPVALAAVRSKVVVMLLLTCCLLLVALLVSVIVICLVVRYFMSILVLQSS